MLKLPESQSSRSLPRQRASNIRSLLDTFILLLVQPPANANGHVSNIANSEQIMMSLADVEHVLLPPKLQS